MSSYCLRCKAHTGDLEPTLTKDKNGRSRMMSYCDECEGKKYRYVAEKKKGKGYNDGNTKYGMGGCYRGGSVFTGGAEEGEQADDDSWYFVKQDLNEYQDEMTNRRIEYMFNTYRQNNADKYTGDDAVENENIDQADDYGNLVDLDAPKYADLDETEQNIMRSLPAMEESEFVLTPQQHEGQGFYVKKIYPTIPQRMLNNCDCFENYRQKVNMAKFVPPTKHLFPVEEHLMDEYAGGMILPHDDRGTFDLKGKIYDPMYIWRERNDYAQNEQEQKVRAMVAKRQVINNSQWI